jgi:hypothetical protein
MKTNLIIVLQNHATCVCRDPVYTFTIYFSNSFQVRHASMSKYHCKHSDLLLYEYSSTVRNNSLYDPWDADDLKAANTWAQSM